MANRGTASGLSSGQFAEFAAAVIRQLPRDLDPTAAQGWIENQDTLAKALYKVLVENEEDSVARIFVDYTKPLSEMIRVCGCRYNDLNITEKHFPINKRPNAKVEMKVFSTKELVGETRIVTSQEVIKALNEKGYWEAELPELLAYGVVNPDEQRKYPIVILGSVWRDFFGGRFVPSLSEWDGRRELDLYWFDSGWHSAVRFLAVRK